MARIKGEEVLDMTGVHVDDFIFRRVSNTNIDSIDALPTGTRTTSCLNFQ